MVATTFAADTPLAITGLIAAYGLAGNWLWWNAALGSVLTVVFFTRLWRRAGVLTDVEFIELRFSNQRLFASWVGWFSYRWLFCRIHVHRVDPTELGYVLRCK